MPLPFIFGAAAAIAGATAIKHGVDALKAKKAKQISLADMNLIGKKDLSSKFKDFTNLEQVISVGSDTSHANNMSRLFEGCSMLHLIDASGMNTANVLDMSYMFANCINLPSINLSMLDTSNIKNMDYMFQGCISLGTVNMAGLNVQNVISLKGMFKGCSSLASIDLMNWNTAHVVDLSEMFMGDMALQTVEMENINTSKVINMSNLFSGCSSIHNLRFKNWNTSSVTDTSYMFCDCKNLSELDLSYLNFQSVNNASSMFDGCENLFSLKIPSMCPIHVETDDICKTISTGRLSAMFRNCSSLRTLDVSGIQVDRATDLGCMFENCRQLENLDISHFHNDCASSGSGIFVAGMFRGCANVKVLDISGLDLSRTSNMSGMFEGCTELISIGEGTEIDMSAISGATGYKDMFKGCNALKGVRLKNVPFDFIPEVAGLQKGQYEILSVDRTKVLGEELENRSDVSGLLRNDSRIENLTAAININTNSLCNMSGICSDCENLKIVELQSLNTESVKDMSNLFDGCHSLSLIDLTGWNTSGVKTMHSMFKGCRSLKNLDLSSFYTANVTDFSYMFAGCSNLTSLNLIVDMRGIGKEEELDDNQGDLYEGEYAKRAANQLYKKTRRIADEWSYANMFEGCENLSEIVLLNIPDNFDPKVAGIKEEQFDRLKFIRHGVLNDQRKRGALDKAREIKESEAGQTAINILKGVVVNSISITGKYIK